MAKTPTVLRCRPRKPKSREARVVMLFVVVMMSFFMRVCTMSEGFSGLVVPETCLPLIICYNILHQLLHEVKEWSRLWVSILQAHSRTITFCGEKRTVVLPAGDVLL